jgi:hypothetical protein
MQSTVSVIVPEGKQKELIVILSSLLVPFTHTIITPTEVGVHVHSALNLNVGGEKREKGLWVRGPL